MHTTFKSMLSKFTHLVFVIGGDGPECSAVSPTVASN